MNDMKKSADEAPEEAYDEESMYLPPRRVIHPSARSKWIRYFYAGLVIGFVCLVFGLTMWGARHGS